MPIMNVCVYGLSSRQLETFFEEGSSRRTQPLVAASAADLCFGLVAGPKSFGLWGRGWPVVLERCSCQREPCVHLLPSRPTEVPPLYQSIGEFLASEHYVAQVDIAAEDLAGLKDASSAGADAGLGSTVGDSRCFDLSCRLVILENAFFRVSLRPDSNITATPGTVIAGVDQQHSMPSSLTVTTTTPSETSDVCVQNGRVQWCAVLDVRPTATHSGAGAIPFVLSAAADNSQVRAEARVEEGRQGADNSASTAEAAATATVCFTSTGEQFGFLHNMPALPPRPPVYALERATADGCRKATAASATAERGILPFYECAHESCVGAAAGGSGPLLALTFYANDPRLPFDQAAWEAGLPENMREVVHYLKREGKEPMRSTTVLEVTGVRPIPVEGSCWCPSSLPMPAPLEQQLREVKSRGTNVSAASPCASISNLPASPVPRVSSEAVPSTPGATDIHSHHESPRRAPRSTALTVPASFLEKGWCVRPLRRVKPVLPDVNNMDDHGHPPLDSNRTQEVWTCLLNLRELEESGIEVAIKVPLIVEDNISYLEGTTVIFSGMLQSSTNGTVLLPVFCTAPDGTTNAKLTSLWVKLYLQYVLIFPFPEFGVRGPLEVVRSRETYCRLTVPTLIGHRGLGKTYTRSPAIISGGAAAPLIVKCNENTIEAFQAAHARGCAMVEFDVMLSADRVPVVIHDPIIELLALKRGDTGGSRGQPEHAPVRAEVHKLSMPQLRDLHAQCCKTFGRVFPLKDMLAHHWEGLVRWTAAHKARLTSEDAHTATVQRQNCTVDSTVLRGEDFPDGVPSLRQVLERTPSSLRFNLEVKYPFQPRWDSNLFLQSDAFEVNGFVDAVLRVVFEFAEDGREITFSSFDPNICLALALKQSRYDVFFLSDTEEVRDLKDYRSFYVEGAIQFAKAQHLAGISMNSGTLLSAEDEAALGHIAEAPIYGVAERGPVPADFFSAATNPSYDAAGVPSFFGSYGRAMVTEMHRRHLKVWTWGGMNSYLYFAYAQAAKMRVDGVIGDRLPVFPS